MAKDKSQVVAFASKEAGYAGSHELLDFYKPHDRSTDMGKFDVSMTRQEFADECDINVIMAQYDRTGVISHVNQREPVYFDFTEVPDFRSAMDMMIEADKAFMSLPANVRRDFDNDAKQFVDFASDSANLDKMREWGLAPPKPPEPPAAAPAVDLAPAPGAPAPIAPKAP